MAIIDFFDRGWRRGPDEIAYVMGDRSWTYDEAGRLSCRVARRLLAVTVGFDQFRVVQSAPMNFGPQPGHELIAEGKDPKNGAELSFVQWLRFGSAGYLRMLGIARRDAWDEAFPRMRALRDGIEPK